MNRVPAYLSIPVILGALAGIFYYISDRELGVNYLNNPYVIGFLCIMLLLLIIVEILNRSIENVRFSLMDEQQRQEYNEKQKDGFWKSVYKSAFKKQSEDQEQTIILDHGFDGIHELDNALPKWWVTLCYITMVYGVSWFVIYFVMDHPTPAQELVVAQARAEKAIEEYEKTAPQATQENAEFKMEYVSDGKEIFQENCAICHQPDGGGSTGPNLTDKEWINQEQEDLYKNIFYVIYNGSKNNPTMRGFGTGGELKGNDIQKVSSYVYYINHSAKKPGNPKEVQGKEWSGTDAFADRFKQE